MAGKNKEQLRKTNNNIPSNVRTAVIHILNENLATGLDLALAVKQAHWNMKGPQFIGVHEMVDGFRSELDGFNDSMAERVTALGGTALGTSKAIQDSSLLGAYPTNIYAVMDHIEALVKHYAVFADSVRKAIQTTEEAGDPVTSDLFTGMSATIDKHLWFLESHLQN